MKYLLMSVILLISTSLFSQQRPCESDSSYRALDFWVGDWTVQNPNGQFVGENTIETILDGCALLENWTGRGGSLGKSLNYYNAHRDVWQQRWIDNSGSPLELEGKPEPGKIVYRGNSVNRRSGVSVMNEMSLIKLSEDQVHQVWKQSSDGGESWNVVFDGLYVRK